jgi:hypothetical protein
LVCIDDDFEFAHPDLVEILHFLQFDQVSYGFLKFHLILPFYRNCVLFVNPECFLQLFAI